MARRSDASWARSIRPWLAALPILWSHAALASESPTPSVVDTAIAGSTQEADAFVEALGDRVGRLGLRLRVERRQDAPDETSWASDVVAGVWIDARSPGRIDLQMTRARGTPRSYDRSLVRDGSTAVVAEEVAQVVGAALESILATQPDDAAIPAASDAPIAPPQAPAPPEANPPPPPARVTPSAGIGLDALAFVGERAMSALSGPVLGAGAAIVVSAQRAPLHPSLMVSGAYDARFDVQRAQVTFDVGSSSLRLIPGVELVDIDALKVDVGVGGGIDLFEVSPLVVRESLAVFDTPTRVVDPVVDAQLLMRLRLASQVRMIFGFNLDYDCALHTTTAPDDHPGAPRSTFEPWRLRPAIEFGLCVPLTSAGGCAKAR